MEPLKIAIVGAGAIAQRNAREALNSGAAKIVGIFDVNQNAARQMSAALSAPTFPSYQAVLEDPGVEAVLISTPHHLHKPHTVEAANHGKHVLLEKPIANNLDEAQEMIAACNRQGVALTVNYSFRYLPKIQQAKEIVDRGALGEVTGVQILSHLYKDPGYWSGARSTTPDDWRASREKSGGGYLIMTLCHVVDYIFFITGMKPRRVYSEYATLGSPAQVEDIISVTAQLENGGIFALSGSSIMRGYGQAQEIIWGTNGTMILDDKGLMFYSTRPVDGKRPGKMHKVTKFPNASWTAIWVRRFAEAVREGIAPEISVREAWENLAFIQSAYQAMEKEGSVEVPAYTQPEA